MPEILDRTVLERLSELNDGNAPDIVLQLASVFMEVTPRRMADLEAAASGRDHEAVFLTAHSLKSGSASLGLQELSAMAAKLETDARNKDQNAIKESHAKLKEGWGRARTELEKVIRERSS